MTEKVKVSREVAAMLEEVWSIEAENVQNKIQSGIWAKMSRQSQEDVIIDRLVRVYQDEEDGGFYNYYGKDYMKKIYEEFPTVRKFIKVLDAGWEVEQTPEEKFNYFYDKYSKSDIQFEKDFLGGMLAVAEWFKLDVKGVNA